LMTKRLVVCLNTTRLSYPILKVVPPIRAVKQLATVGAVLRETARLPQAATVM